MVLKDKRTEERTETHARDCISRQAAIDALQKEISKGIPPFDDVIGSIRCGVRLARNIIEDLPSLQPEIVRCKDCKHRDPEDRKCDCGHDILWQLPRQDDWYCADAERRTHG